MAGDKFMPEMHLKQPSFTYHVCGPFTKNLRNQRFLQKGNRNYIYKNDLDKACFKIIWLMVKAKIWLKEHNQTSFERKSF